MEWMMEPVYDIRKILEFLPHRYPFLLVDRVLSVVPEENITALKNVTFNEPFFQGHFPGMPVMPGVLMVEAMAQTSGILVISSMPEDQYGALMYFMGMDKVKFRRAVVPGDQLIIEARMLKRRARTAKLDCKITVNEAVAAEAELMAMIEEKK
jgi:3-hydroxyacyl-[acyl-carrier-protein] dehydratase